MPVKVAQQIASGLQYPKLVDEQVVCTQGAGYVRNLVCFLKILQSPFRFICFLGKVREIDE